VCVCPQTGQVHSYSLILPLFWILFFWSTVSRCLAGLFSLGYFVPLLRPVLGVCLGLCLSASHLLLPALAVLLCRVSICLCALLVVLLSGAARFFSLVAAVWCFLLGCFARLCFWCVGLLRLGSLSPCFVPPLPRPPPRLVVWCLLVQSVFCWSLPLGIWLYLRRPGCHACGMVCCDGLAPVFTSPHGNKGFGPVWGFALYTMLRVLFWCPTFLH